MIYSSSCTFHHHGPIRPMVDHRLLVRHQYRHCRKYHRLLTAMLMRLQTHVDITALHIPRAIGSLHFYAEITRSWRPSLVRVWQVRSAFMQHRCFNRRYALAPPYAWTKSTLLSCRLHHRHREGSGCSFWSLPSRIEVKSHSKRPYHWYSLEREILRHSYVGAPALVIAPRRLTAWR